MIHNKTMARIFLALPHSGIFLLFRACRRVFTASASWQFCSLLAAWRCAFSVRAALPLFPTSRFVLFNRT